MAAVSVKRSIVYYMASCFFRKPVIGPWALRETKALPLANQGARYIGYKKEQAIYICIYTFNNLIYKAQFSTNSVYNAGVITLLYLHNHSYFTYNTGYLYRKYNYSITYNTSYLHY